MSDSQSPNSHDRFVRQVFARPPVAAAFFQLALPPLVAADIDAESVEALPTDGIGPGLGETRGDLMFRVHARHHDFFVLLILEHQSSYDALMPLRLLEYKTAAWRIHAKEKPGELLPHIHATVLYHGRQAWRGRHCLADLFAKVESMRPSLPDFEFSVVDLGRHPDEELLRLVDEGAPYTGLSLLGLKWSREPELPSRLSDWVDRPRSGPISEQELQAWQELTVYLSQTCRIDAKEIYDVYSRAASKEYREMSKTIAEQLRAEGVEIGRSEGVEIGRAEGARKALLDLLLSTP